MKKGNRNGPVKAALQLPAAHSDTNIQIPPLQSLIYTLLKSFLEDTFAVLKLKKMTTTETIIKMMFDRWNASLKNCDAILNALSDEQLQKEIAPGKNRGIYLLGHLVAVHDDMIILLDMGEKMYPELNGPFIKSPDKAVPQIPSAAELRSCWVKQCEVLKQQFGKLKPEEWFEKHTAVSAEDFAKEPHRNKLNIILTRTTHLQYHLGQLALLQ